MPRNLQSTSSQDLPPRASAAAPAAAAVLTAHRVLPHPGAPPVQSPPPAGPSEGQDPAPHSRLSLRERRKLMHRIYLISWSPHQTPFGQMLRVWTCPSAQAPSGPAVPGGRERLEGPDRAALPNQGLSWRTGQGLGIQLAPGLPGPLPSRAQCIDNL